MAVYSEVIGTQRQAKTRERVFYSGMAIAILMVIFVGFSRTFYLRPYFHSERLIPLLILHGIVFSSWIALFVTQTTLVATKRTRIHMKLGVAGGVIAALMIIIGTLTAIVRAKGPSPVPGVNPLSFLTIPLGDMLVFGILVGSAFYFRRRLDVHKRLMLLATISLVPAAVARLPIGFIETGGPPLFYGLSDLFIVPCLIYYFATRRRPHRPTVLAGFIIPIPQPPRPLVWTTPASLPVPAWATAPT